MTDAVLAGENQRVCKQLLACWANKLLFDILNSHLKMKTKRQSQKLLVRKHVGTLIRVECMGLFFQTRIKKQTLKSELP